MTEPQFRRNFLLGLFICLIVCAILFFTALDLLAQPTVPARRCAIPLHALLAPVPNPGDTLTLRWACGTHYTPGVGTFTNLCGAFLVIDSLTIDSLYAHRP